VRPAWSVVRKVAPGELAAVAEHPEERLAAGDRVEPEPGRVAALLLVHLLDGRDELVGLGGVDPARAHHVHAHLRTEAERERMRERDDAALRRGVGFGVRLGLQRARRSHVDDRRSEGKK